MSEENTNETTDEPEPEPTKSELHERVEQLESTVAKMMPSRRDALKLGAAGIAGAAGLSATSQSAAASTGSAGQIGDSSNRPDVFADEINTNIQTFGESRIVEDTFTLADDTATSFSDFSQHQFFFLGGASNRSGGVMGLLEFEQVRIAAAQVSIGTVTTISDTQLTGTTGTDGNVTLSQSGKDFFIENRTGASRNYALLRIKMF